MYIYLFCYSNKYITLFSKVYVGIIANLVVFPVNFIIITLFRKARPKQKRTSRIQEAIRKSKRRSSNASQSSARPFADDSYNENCGVTTVTSSADYPMTARMIDTSNLDNRSLKSFNLSDSFNADDLKPRESEPKKKKSCFKIPDSLPWWYRWVAWSLLVATVAASSAFVLFYGVMFGEYKCKKWITSMMISFVTSILFTQPLKVNHLNSLHTTSKGKSP